MARPEPALIMGIMAKAVRFHELGGPEVLRLEEVPETLPGPDELRIEVVAIGLNRAEVNFRRGRYIDRPGPLPSPTLRVCPASLVFPALR